MKLGASFKKKLGIFGGAFDPPHNAHVSLVKAFQAEHPSTPVVVLPTGQAWHKPRTLTDFQHRVAMAKLAFAELPNVIIDTREIEREGATYTIDTLLALQAEHPDTELFLIVGDDQKNAFQTWHRWQDILKVATLCVTPRALMPMSSTDIRANLTNQSLPDNISSAVASYIHQHNLYK